MSDCTRTHFGIMELQVPAVGSKAMFFACGSPEMYNERNAETEIEINEFTLHAGMLQFQGPAPKSMMKPAVSRCGGTRLPESCEGKVDTLGRVCQRERRFNTRQCLDSTFACENYGKCCSNSAYKVR